MQNLDGKLITLLGGSGFLGRYTAQALLARGARLRVAGRTATSGRLVKSLGNPGQVQLIAADVGNPASLARALDSADMAVNLVGSFDNVNAIQHIGAGNVASAAAAAGCSALVHMSAIGGDTSSPAEYGRSKAAGEIAVRAAFPGAVILRPSIVFGREDQFINRFAGLIRMLPVVPIIGARTRFQPVFVGDVAAAVVAALSDETLAGRTLDLGGPEVLTMRALNEWIARAIGHDPMFIDVPGFAAHGMAAATGWLPAAPITLDQFRMLGRDNVVDAERDGLDIMEIAKTPLDAVAEGWLDIYKKHGRFAGGAKA